MLGNHSLLRMAYERATQLVEPSSIYVSTLAAYEALTRAELPELPAGNLILEPVGRNTAPALGLAALSLQRSGGDPILVALPSDHYIDGDEPFTTAIETAVAAAREGYVATVGLRPTRPETGYGYMRLGEELGVADGVPCYKAAQFTEKPDAATARGYCSGGQHLWNSGIVVSRLSVLLHELERHAPAVYQALHEIDVAPSTARFASLPSLSFDYAVLERSDRIVTVLAEFAWDDLGDWAALGRRLSADEQGNVVIGRALLHDCNGLVVDNSGDRLIVAVGVTDLVVVSTPEAILVCRKDCTQAIRQVATAVTEAPKPVGLDQPQTT
jgi:mannose-1-phosphate guanylyltransferase